MNKRELGMRYERYAEHYLVRQGYRILERNFRCMQGEIDLIAREGKYLVFIEIKYRKNLRSGMPAEAVDAKKQQRIRQAARYYLYRKHYGEETPCRFDVVGIAGEQISLIRDAF